MSVYISMVTYGVDPIRFLGRCAESRGYLGQSSSESTLRQCKGGS